MHYCMHFELKIPVQAVELLAGKYDEFTFADLS
jgi:hypothetical protein